MFPIVLIYKTTAKTDIRKATVTHQEKRKAYNLHVDLDFPTEIQSTTLEPVTDEVYQFNNPYKQWTEPIFLCLNPLELNPEYHDGAAALIINHCLSLHYLTKHLKLLFDLFVHLEQIISNNKPLFAAFPTAN